ncbi:response regulator [Flavilitoribacter nigricans]|nr:hypothetical protein [Flavilitoribacter nigricans]
MVLRTSYNEMFRLSGIATDFEAAKRMIVLGKPSILLLGDQLPGCPLNVLVEQNFIQLADHRIALARKKRYAFDCFQRSIDHYLLKPIKASDLDQALSTYRPQEVSFLAHCNFPF